MVIGRREVHCDFLFFEEALKYLTGLVVQTLDG
jgi:hypothetical protein